MFRRWILFRPDDGSGEPAGGASIEAGTDDGRPGWLPDKFATPEAFAQSYAEAEKELARVRNAQQEQQREFQSALQRIEAEIQKPAPPVYQGQQDPLLAAAQRAYDDGDVPTLLAIGAQISQAATAQLLDERLKPLTEGMGGATQADRDIALRLAEQQVSPAWGDQWSDLAPKLNEMIGARPDLLPTTPSVEGYAAVLTSLAKQVDYDRLSTAQAAAEQERAAKLTGNTLGSSTARVATNTDEKKQAWDEIKNAPTQSWQNLVGG